MYLKYQSKINELNLTIEKKINLIKFSYLNSYFHLLKKSKFHHCY